MLLCLQARAATVTWTGSGDGVSWSDPLNWSGNVLPPPGSDVTIGATAGNPTILFTSAAGVVQIFTLNTSEPMTFSGGTLQVWSLATSQNLTLSGGTIQGMIQGTTGGASSTVVYTTGQEVPFISTDVQVASTVSFSLNYAPMAGTNLMVVKNTGQAFLGGGFSNLTQGQVVPLTYNGVTYNFVANYHGGTGNDLVLQWGTTKTLAWGYNQLGQLGNNSTSQSNAPLATSMAGVLYGKTVIALAVGGAHSLALCSDGTLAAWGDNNSGQLGNNSTTSSDVPVAVNMTTPGGLAGKTVIAIAAGGAHSMALCSDSTVATWGERPARPVGQ